MNTNPNSSGIACVTGSSSGIGRAVAARLSRDGFHIWIHYNKNRRGAEELQTQILQAGRTAEILCFDVADSASIESALEASSKAPENLGRRFSVLVNNAGMHQDNLLGLMSDAAFDEVIRTNVHGPFYLMRWFVRKMIRQRSGSIVNMASLAGQTGNAGQINYAASKAALIAMTKTLSMEVGSRGIRVNSVAPGLIETDMISELPHLNELKARIPLARLGTPEDVAGAVSFLCSADAAYVTGHTLSVNGGLFPT